MSFAWYQHGRAVRDALIEERAARGRCGVLLRVVERFPGLTLNALDSWVRRQRDRAWHHAAVPSWAVGYSDHNGGEWACEHGVGHPTAWATNSVHGCDGCCGKPAQRAKALAEYEQRRAEAVREVSPEPSGVAPFAVPIAPYTAALDQASNFTALLYGDAQAPYHDEQAQALVRAIAKETTPDVVLDMGDAVDAYPISKYSKDYRRHAELQTDINACRRNLYRMAEASPSSRHVLLEGNHETRMQRCLDRQPAEVQQILRLDRIAPTLRWPYLLDLENAGFDWIDTEHQPSETVLPKVLVEHGSIVSSFAGYTARRELEKHGRSGFSGHTHRMASYARRDFNGQARWTETGFTALYSQPYGSQFNWQQGCVFAEWSTDRKLMQVHEIFFRDGRALWRGREIITTEAAP